MEIGAMLDELREKALKDRNIWQELMDTRKAEQPLAAFCAKCRELGYQIYEMDLITAGEEFYATMRRSTNGGGENSPKLAGEDDFYELFFASLEEHIQANSEVDDFICLAFGTAIKVIDITINEQVRDFA